MEADSSSFSSIFLLFQKGPPALDSLIPLLFPDLISVQQKTPVKFLSRTKTFKREISIRLVSMVTIMGAPTLPLPLREPPQIRVIPSPRPSEGLFLAAAAMKEFSPISNNCRGIIFSEVGMKNLILRTSNVGESHLN